MGMHSRVIAFAVLLLGTVWVARGEDGLSSAVFAYLDAADERQAEAALSEVLSRKPTAAQVEAALSGGRRYAPAAGGWGESAARGPDGVERGFLTYVPPAYKPTQPAPLIVYLHGFVSGTAKRTAVIDARHRGECRMFQRFADGIGALMVCPRGTKDAAWWQANGAAQVLADLAAAKRRFNVDEDRVFVMGFSDGASGSLHMALNRPTPLAGAVPLSGSLIVSQMGGFAAYPTNLRRTPLHVVNTDLDEFYPTDREKQIADALERLGVPITFRSYPEIAHKATYLDREAPEILAFLKRTRRDAAPKRIDWECHDPATGRCDWIEILWIDRRVRSRSRALRETQIRLRPTRVAIGVRLDRESAGPGAKVVKVVPQSTAARMGLRPGDVITQIDGRAVAGWADFRSALRAKPIEGRLSLTFQRGGRSHTRTTRLPPARPRPVLSRTKPSGRVLATVEGNRIAVQCRGVGRYRVLVRRGVFNLDEPITVTTNNRRSFRGRLSADVPFLLRQARADLDRTRVYVAAIDVQVRR
jgi:predicted esterase